MLVCPNTPERITTERSLVMCVANRSIAILAGLLVCVSAVAARAQSPLNPTVAMSVTLPDGHTQELSAHEGGLATVKVGAREFGFRPTMFDDQGTRMAVTIFDMGSSTEAVKEL